MRRHGPVIAHCTDSEDFPICAEVLSRGPFGTGTGTELSRPPANIFATVGCTEGRFNITRYY